MKRGLVWGKLLTVLLIGLTVTPAQGASPPEVLPQKVRRGAIPLKNAAYHSLAGGPLIQDWSNTGLIDNDDDWSNVPSIIGYRGEGLVSETGTDPRTVLADGANTSVNVFADETLTSNFWNGGIAEFHLANPVVAFQGSLNANAPFLLIFLNTTGVTNIKVSYILRDIDINADDSVQQVALQYRIGTVGNFANVPGGYIEDASDGPNLTKETPLDVILPPEVEGHLQVQLRIITTDANGTDELIGIDDLNISAEALPTPTSTFTATPLPTQTPTPTPTATSTATASPTATPTPTPPAPTATASPTFTATPSPTASPTATPTATATATASPTFTATPLPTQTPTATPTATSTATASPTFTVTASPTASPTATPTATATAPPSVTLTPNPTFTPVPSPTLPAATSTPTATFTSSLTPPAVLTPTPSAMVSPTLSPTSSPTTTQPAPAPSVLTSFTYLPLVFKYETGLPDLVISHLLATGDVITVGIKNQGTGPVRDAFWLDVYLNPSTPPTQVNQRWQDVADQGLVWGVTVPALPLESGQVLTLTLQDAYYFGPPVSHVSWPIPAGSIIYAQIDSVNFATSHGNVLEQNEANNIIGPIISTFGASKAGNEPAKQRRSPIWPRRLPLR